MTVNIIEVEPTWPRGMYGSPTDLYDARTLTNAGAEAAQSALFDAAREIRDNDGAFRIADWIGKTGPTGLPERPRLPVLAAGNRRAMYDATQLAQHLANSAREALLAVARETTDTDLAEYLIKRAAGV